MRKIKNLGGAVLALTLAFGGLIVAAPASATETECVPSAAYTTTTPGTPAVEAVYETVVVSEAGWQRYSYNGPWDSEEAPAFPGDKWQPNVKGDPQNIGVEGAYFRSHGNEGNGDWFYLKAIPAVTEQHLVTPAVLATDDVVVEHPAVVCEPPVVVTPPEAPKVGVCNAFESTTYTAVDAEGTLPSTIFTSETRKAGHNQIVGTNLRVWTTEATSLGKAAGYFATPGLTLGHIGTPTINYVSTSGVKPGFQIVLSTGRILVGEPDAYGDRFWSKKAQDGVPANDGYAASADLNTWFGAMGDVSVAYIGYSVGSGVLGDSLISSLSLGSGCDIKFGPFVPVVIPPVVVEPPVVVVPPVVVTPPVVVPPVVVAPPVVDVPVVDVPAAIVPVADVVKAPVVVAQKLANTGLTVDLLPIGVGGLFLLFAGLFVLLTRKRLANDKL